MKSNEKEYNEKLLNGTEIKVKIIVEVKNYNEKDYRDLFGRFSALSRRFYLNELKSIVDAD